MPAGFVDRAADGTPLYAPRGELAVDADGQRVQCHLCGRWFRMLGSSHVRHAHGLSAEAYRELVGLRPRRALSAPDVTAAQSRRYRERLAREPELRAALAVGLAMARTGELQQRARQVSVERSVSLERERQLRRDGSRVGRGRAEAFRQRREQAARAAGFSSLEAFYTRRYGEQRRRVEQLALELGCHWSTVRGDLMRLDLGPDRTRSYGARWKRPA